MPHRRTTAHLPHSEAPADGHQGMTPAQDVGIVDGLAQLSFLVQAALGKVATQHGLSVIQLRLLGILRDRTPGMQELARHLGLDKSSMTGLVDRAERRDLVRRIRSEQDKRSVLVELTAQGHDLAHRAAADADEQILGLTAHLTDAQRSQLSSLASALVAGHAAI